MILSTQRNQSGSKRIENEALIVTAAKKVFADMGYAGATTQHYADFQHQICTLNNNSDLTETQWSEVKEDIKKLVLKGLGAELFTECQTLSED